MYEWIQNGCRLAWLLDIASETAYIYRADGTESVAHGFDASLYGEDVLSSSTKVIWDRQQGSMLPCSQDCTGKLLITNLPGFTLDLAELRKG